MTLKEDKQRTYLLTVVVLLGATVVILPGIQSAFAQSDCFQPLHFWGPKCRGDQTNDNNYHGMKADIKVPDIVTSSNCDPDNKGFALLGMWMVYPNGAWIETGIAQGNIAGTCYTDEREYLVWTRNNEPETYNEEYVRDVSRGHRITYEISDKDHDRTWQVISDETIRINLVTAYAQGSYMIVGLEATADDTSIPKTTISHIEYLDGDTWHRWESGSNKQNLDGWIKDCHNNSRIKVGIGDRARC